MATASLPSQASIRLKLELPQRVLETYERQAEECGVPLEDLIAARLCDSVQHTSTKPIYLTDEDRRRLDFLFGLNLNTAADVIKQVQTLCTMRVDNVRVNLDQHIRKRLTTRHLDRGITYDEHVARIVKKLLAEYVGR